MTKTEAVKSLEKVFQMYFEQNTRPHNLQKLAEIVISHCEIELNMIPVTSKNTFWNIVSGKCVDPSVNPWEEMYSDDYETFFSKPKT